MLRLRKIAITGGISSGKSAVLKFLQECGAFTVNADDLAHQLLSPTSQVGKQVIQLLGHQILENSKISRKKIAEVVFQNPETLKKLEKLLHPIVLKEIEKLYSEVQKKNAFYLFAVEFPLVFEIESQDFYDFVIAVVSDPALCEKRFKQGAKEYNRRMAFQLSQEEKARKADFVLTNNEGLKELKQQVKKLYETLIKA